MNKKILALVLTVFTLGVILGGCNKSDDTAGTAGGTATATTTTGGTATAK